MTSKASTTLAFIGVVLLGAGLLSISKNPSPHQLFQPEAQMLTSATEPTATLQRPERAMASLSRNTILPYAFQTTLCASETQSAKKFTCMESYYKNLVTNYGVDVAFSDLKKRYVLDPYVVVQCHPLTHVIGREAVNFYPTASEAYLHGDSFCWSGYYHGVLEGIVKKIGRDALPEKINSICADIPGKENYTFQYYNCVHGLGHGIMELYGDDVVTSLKLCDTATGLWEQQSCYSGVFMENIIVFNRDGSTPDLRPAEPLYPCTTVEDKYKYQCYLGQTSFVLSQNGGDFKKTFDVCAGVETPAFRAICDQSIGRDAANYAQHDGPSTKTTCSLSAVSEDRGNCIVGAVKEFISYYHAIEQANAFCNLFTDPEKTNCLTTGKQYFTIF